MKICAYCDREVDLEDIGNRIVPPYILELPDKDEIFCSAICGNKYCVDNGIPFRFCINPKCAERGQYYKKRIILQPHVIFCSDCFLAIQVKCEWCGRKYYSNRSKAQKAYEPERFCSIKCENLFRSRDGARAPSLPGVRRAVRSAHPVWDAYLGKNEMKK